MAKTYPTLYKVDKTGKKRLWKIEIIVESASAVTIRSTFGVEGGKMQTEEERVTEGKQNRNPLEQAELMANKRFQDKWRLNYRPEGKMDELEVKPYLLMMYEEKKDKIKWPALISRKVDGTRGLFSFKRTGDKYTSMKFTTRSCNEIPNPLLAIKEDMVRSGFLGRIPDHIILDGEVYKHGMNFNVLSGLTRKTPGKMTDSDKKVSASLDYYIFDFLDPKKPDLTFLERYNQLRVWFKKTGDMARVQLIRQELVRNDAEVKAKFKQYLSEGYEGAVIRNKDFTYKQTRICDVLKLKPDIEMEFKIIDAKKGKRDEVIWILEVPQKDGRKTTVNSTMNAPHDDLVKYYRDRKKYIGAWATVNFMEWSITEKEDKKTGEIVETATPRHPKTKAIRWDL